MLALLLIITLPLFYIFKGIIIKETKFITIITMIIFAGNICIAYYMKDNWLKTAVLVYLTYTFADYLFLMIFKREIVTFPLMTRISIMSDEAIISYKLFRPAILIPVNIYLFFKRYPRIGLNDCIGVDIKTKDGAKIKINL
ncbi:MAG TPA: hypothetical protein PLK90_03270 [Clostridiales bacterium]|jgi:hypothetical protein|nr:hypothetical protein [Clostridiales bacterium]HQP69400.1 hypothetical protein [Clostridiales bacterium]